jgi:hypothetical protein
VLIMDNEHGVTRANITCGLRTFGAGPLPVLVDLDYDTSDPYAVTATFRTGRNSVVWMFGRDLLADGLLVPTGDGDVRVSPATDPALVVIELNAPGGSAVFDAPADDLAAFLDCTYEQLPVGTESDWFDFDLELAKLADLA